METVNFVVCLKSGGDFSIDDVDIIGRMVSRNCETPVKFLPITDVGVGKPLAHDYPGWWCIMEAFDIVGPVVFTGLDTVIIDSIDPLLDYARRMSQSEFCMLRPFSDNRKYGYWASGFMLWNGDWRWLHEQFTPSCDIPVHTYEQAYTSSKLIENNIKVYEIQDYVNGIYSYKRHCRVDGLPDDARVVLFHGEPRPKDAPEAWVKKYYK